MTLISIFASVSAIPLRSGSTYYSQASGLLSQRSVLFCHDDENWFAGSTSLQRVTVTKWSYYRLQAYILNAVDGPALILNVADLKVLHLGSAVHAANLSFDGTRRGHHENDHNASINAFAYRYAGGMFRFRPGDFTGQRRR